MLLQVIASNSSREIPVSDLKQATTPSGPEMEAVILTLNGEQWKTHRISPSAQRHLPQLAGLLARAFGLILAFVLTGCHSAFIDATVSNRTSSAISLVQVEYPSASFGIQTITPGADFHYRFKLLGSGPMKITYTDYAQHEQKATGPILTEGTQGALAITVAPDGVHWQPPPATH